MELYKAKELDSKTVEKLADSLRMGNIGVWRTDTIYGYFCRYDAPESVERVYRIKGRPKDQKFSVAFAELQTILTWFEVSARLEFLLRSTLPGPLTYILTPRKEYKHILQSGEKNMGVRVPDHELTLELCRLTASPLITTSANRSGEGNARNPADIPGEDEIDFLIDSGSIKEPVASTVVLPENDKLTILREGAYSADKLKNLWEMYEEGKR